MDVVVANDAEIDPEIRQKYLDTENKTVVALDYEKIAEQGAEVIEDDIFCIEDGRIRHDALKTGFLVFSYLMRHEEKKNEQ